MTEGPHINNAADTRRRRAPVLPGLASAGGALLCAVALACNNPTPDLRPPPFGPDTNHPEAVRLFFPSGMTVYKPTGHLLVVNGNFDHAFDGGTIVSFDPARDFQPYFSYYDSSGALPATQLLPVIAPLVRGVAMVGNYGGPLEVYADPASGRVRAFTASRDGNAVHSVQLDPATGVLSCKGGGPTDIDCRRGVFDTFGAVCPAGLCPPGPTTLSLEGPYGLAVGDAALPGATTPPNNVLFVSALIPHIDAILNNTLYMRSQFAAVTLDSAAPSLFYAANASSETVANGIGAGPIVFDKARRRLILGGCYTRTASANGSALSSYKCTSSSANLLRFVSVDEGPDANVQAVDIAAVIRSLETTGLALGGVDPSDPNQIPQRLYAALRNPDLLVEMDLPATPGQFVTVLRATALPVAPAGLAVLPRPATGSGPPPPPDLIAVAAEASGNVTIYDTGSGQVVANLEGLGKLPYTLTVLQPQPADTAAAGANLADPRAHLAATVFDGCALALIDVPYQRPWKSALRAILGSCP
ncbi:MAG TPA: hypothetical protein VN874_05945 [Myxococcales bacterium]|nr:hypothetical protein [Myxococcales bacterium]